MTKLDAKELAEYADSRWHVRNARKPTSSVMAAVEDSSEVDQLAETVAAMPGPSRRNKKPQKKNGGQHGGQHGGQQGGQQAGQSGGQHGKKQYFCRSHCRWGEKTWECADPKFCTFPGNGDAGGL